MILDFKEILNEEIPKSEIVKLEKDIYNLQRYLNKIKGYFDCNIPQIRSFVFEELDNQLEEYITIISTDLIQREVNALETLNNNKHLLKDYYQKLKTQDLDDFDINSEKEQLRGNEAQAQLFEAKAILQAIRREKDKIDPIFIKFAKDIFYCKNPKEKQEYQRKLQQDRELRDIYEYALIFIQDSEEGIFEKYAEYRLNEAKKVLRQNEKQRLKITGQFFKKYNLLEDMRNRTNQDYIELGLEEMCYQKRTDDLQDDVGVENIFEDEYIDTLDDEQLDLLNAYWQNRFTKEADGIKNALFTIENLQLWNEILDKNINEIISTEELEQSLKKIQITNKVFEIMKDNSNVQKRVAENIVCSILDLDDINPEFKQQYEEYFDNVLPESQNGFYGDFAMVQSTRNMIDEIYNMKRSKITQLLLNLGRNSKVTNWGYIPEYKKGINSICSGKSKILIGIDYPGFNIPVKLHTDKQQLCEIFSKTKNSTIIPIYEDMNSYKIAGRSRARSLLMPLTEKREEYLIKTSKQISTIDKKYNFVRHLSTLVTKKVKSIKKIYPSRYVDLQNGDEGHLVNREFRPDMKSVQIEDETEK